MTRDLVEEYSQLREEAREMYYSGKLTKLRGDVLDVFIDEMEDRQNRMIAIAKRLTVDEKKELGILNVRCLKGGRRL